MKGLKRRRRYDNICVLDLLYADDTGFVSHSEVDLHTILDRFAAAPVSVGLSTNVRKTEVLHQPAPGILYTASTVTDRRSCEVVYNNYYYYIMVKNESV